MRARLLALTLLLTALPPAGNADGGIVTRTRTAGDPPAMSTTRNAAAATATTGRSEVVRILAQFGSATRVCSGVMVAPRIAVTAGRCVHQGAGGNFALDFWVQPGTDGSSLPFGQAFGSLLITFSEWTERSDPAFDIGFVVLDRALGDRSGHVAPARLEGCGGYGGSAATWAGYASIDGGQVAESGPAACAENSLTVASTTTFAAGTPLFAADGRVHGIAATRSEGQLRFTRFNARTLGYFTDSLRDSLDPCEARVEADRIDFGAGVGEALVAVTTGQGCSWAVEGTMPSWLTVQSGRGASFGRPIFQVAANTGAARSVTVTIEGKALAISQAAAGPAANARFSAAATLGGSIVSTRVDTSGAGRDAEAPAPAGATGGAGAWWRWTAPTTTFATVSVTGDRLSPAVGVYTGSRAGALSLVAEGRESVSFTGVAGITYTIFATGIGGGEGAMRLQVEQLVPGAEAQTGWWWNPAEPGRGLFLETNATSSFLGWFAYDSAGGWLWQVSHGSVLTRRFLRGSLASFRAGQTLGGPYRAPAPAGDAGAATLSLASATRGTLAAGGTQIPLERFVFAPGGIQADRAAFVPETGWWWTPSEPGTGYAIEVQGGLLMIGVFHYDADGSSRWSIAQGAMSDPRIFEGTLVSYRGGQTLGDAWRAPTSATETGRITLRFADATRATVVLPGGRQVAIERFRF